MTSASYGRMQIGRCVEEDLGFLGCQNDALEAVDSECSGKHTCEVQVTKQKFRKNVPGACRKGLSGYAQMSYQCKRGRIWYSVDSVQMPRV